MPDARSIALVPFIICLEGEKARAACNALVFVHTRGKAMDAKRAKSRKPDQTRTRFHLRKRELIHMFKDASNPSAFNYTSDSQVKSSTERVDLIIQILIQSKAWVGRISCKRAS